MLGPRAPAAPQSSDTEPDCPEARLERSRHDLWYVFGLGFVSALTCSSSNDMSIYVAIANNVQHGSSDPNRTPKLLATLCPTWETGFSC